MRERRWGEESIVFDIYSGETHHLNALTSAIFRRVSAMGSVDLDALCTELACLDGDGDASENSPESIGSAAARLCHIGLIRAEDGGT